MKVQLLFFILLFSGGSLYSQNSYTLSITVQNIRSEKGTLRLCLINKKTDFPYTCFQAQIVPVRGKEVKVYFRNTSPGTYAISVFHDENENEKLDTRLFGIPTEDYGFSNQAKGVFGPPDFEEAAFRVSGDQELVIRL